MLNVETIRKVRQAHFRDGKGIREITRDFNLSRNTVRNNIRTGLIDQKYVRSEQPHPKLGSFIERLTELLKEATGAAPRSCLSNCSGKDLKAAMTLFVVMWAHGRKQTARLQSKPTSLLNMTPETPSSSTGVTSRWSWVASRSELRSPTSVYSLCPMKPPFRY